MKNFSYLFMAGLMTLGLWSCSDDADITAGGENEISGDVYMSFKLELPTAGRSATDEPDSDDPDGGDTNSDANPDFEVGTTGENKISHLKVVLAQKEGDGTYTALAVSQDETLGGANVDYVATFDAVDMIGETVADQNVYVFVFCNYSGITTLAEWQNVLDGSKTINSINDITGDNQFWMANAELSEVKMPKSTDYPKYNTPATAFDLGEVKVERAAARFDFKETNDNVYELESGKVKVTLTDMALVNMSNSFYYLRRVANANTESDKEKQADLTNVIICGTEKYNNYVVDTDATDKMNELQLPNNFFYHWSNITIQETPTMMDFQDLWGNLNPAKIADFDKDDNWNDEQYKFWCYATENTLPSIDSQIKGLSTGVLFRGELSVVEDDDKRLDGSFAYVYNNVLYGQWSDIKAKFTDENATLSDELIRLQDAYQAVAATMGTSDENPDKAKAAAAGFTVYEKVDGKFYVYYYYINKHNDNFVSVEDPKNDEMGPMEFAVVRNNVYKLAVTKINKYGHPGDPTGDPDPENPIDPDEEKEVYFTVSVKVLPWVVRVNNIEF